MRKKSFFQIFLWMACLLSLLLLTACASQPTLDTSEPPTLPTAGQTPVAQRPSFPEGKVLFTYKGHQQRDSDGRMRRVTEIQWSPDGKRIASSDGATLDIWDALTGEHAFRVPLKSIDRFTWSPDSRYIAVNEYKNGSSAILIWDTSTNKIKLTLDGQVYSLVTPAWSPDGKYIAGSNSDRKTVQIWSPASGKILVTLAPSASPIQTLAWAPDSQRLLNATENNLQILSIPAGKVLETYPLPLSSATAVSWSPDGKMIASTSSSPPEENPAIAIRASDTGKLVDTYIGYGAWPTVAQFSPDGKRLLVADGYEKLQIRNVAASNFIFSYTGMVHGLITTACWSPDGKYVASSDENTIQVWSATPGREMLTYLGLASLDGNGNYGVAALAYAPNGQYIVASGDDRKKTIQVWSAKNGTHILTRSGVARSLAWSPNSALIASAQTDNTIYIWNALTGQQLLAYKGHQAEIQKVSWSPDGKSLVSADMDGHIQIWDASTGHLHTSLTDPRHDLFAIALSPDGHFLVEGGNSLNVWNLATGKIVYTYKGQRNVIYAAASWSPDGKRIASAGTDQTVQVWDATTGGHPLTYRNHHEKVFLVAWSPDGKYLVSASDDPAMRSIQVWNASTGKTVATYGGVLSNVYVLDWAPDSTAIALGGLQAQDDMSIVQLWHPV